MNIFSFFKLSWNNEFSLKMCRIILYFQRGPGTFYFLLVWLIVSEAVLPQNSTISIQILNFQIGFSDFFFDRCIGIIKNRFKSFIIDTIMFLNFRFGDKEFYSQYHFLFFFSSIEVKTILMNFLFNISFQNSVHLLTLSKNFSLPPFRLNKFNILRSDCISLDKIIWKFLFCLSRKKIAYYIKFFIFKCLF